MAKKVLTRMPSNSEFIYLVMTTIVCVLTGLGAYMLFERPVMSWAKVWHKRSDMRTVKSVAV
jgi:peptidoglycan/LPS O-acetylase OafA/YrhL